MGHLARVTGAASALMDRLRPADQPVAPADVRMLVVDDEPIVREFVRRVLHKAGYNPLLAESGPDAIAKADTIDRIDLLVTDLVMPDMTGDELARRLRQRDASLKVLYLTGFCDRLFEAKSQLWEDEAYLDKPCSISALAQAVAMLVYGHSQPPDTDPLPE